MRLGRSVAKISTVEIVEQDVGGVKVKGVVGRGPQFVRVMSKMLIAEDILVELQLG
jgi:hypothetical protein